MSQRWYELRVADSYILLSDADITSFGLSHIQTLSERALRSHLRSLGNRSTAEAIHAMLDQQPDNCQIFIVPHNPDQTL